MKILAIETSCDETSVAVVEDGYKVLSLVVNSQIDLHKAFGGVVPEVAARSHVEVMIPVVAQALAEAFARGKSQAPHSKQTQNSGNQSSQDISLITDHEYWDQIDAIAVTQGPGLLGSLLIGALTARTLAWSLNKPLIAVHHILGHIYANWITKQEVTSGSDILQTPDLNFPSTQPEFPALALIVSGGHTQLMYGTSHTDWKVIGRTQDDAVGEAFDKVAKVLGFPYPGGLNVSKAAENGDPNKYHLPTPQVSSIDPGLTDLRSKLSDPSFKVSYNFSFSGLKTAVLRAVQQECGKDYSFPSFELKSLLNEAQKANFSASFEKVAIDYLVSKTKLAYDEFQPKTVIIGGGIAASVPLRNTLSAALPLEIQYAPRILCTDNAAMIGARAYFQYKNKELADPHQLEVKPSWPL